MKALTKAIFAFLLVASVENAFADTQDRHLTGFNAINAGGSFDVYITQGNTESVKVEAPADVMDKLITEVNGGVLKIYTKSGSWGNFNWFGGNHKKTVVYVTAKQLNSITESGSGDVFFKDGITAPSLKLKVSGSGDMVGKVDTKDVEIGVSGSGDMKLLGRAVNASVGVSGSGDFSGSGLVTTNTTVRVSGSGDAAVNVNEKLDASVSGSGDVSYSGSAKNVNASASGSGSVHKGR
ncbi:head GIN domain-containing protein [Mucilaginibacter agri]|uniref:DUF2807 domain-containing protein n=1 Tax=Mucilaginibacter agri TaxID=2695265 RepID=A0A966DTD1_9SPHI|nr:head GIN domain-containing protein [Mucilaginibacter agri]NCD70540.1 DUF2807 domain-containing protein [Mucilaginibacter agri]